MSMSKGNILPIPVDAPKTGEIYAHYKTGDKYRVIDIALHSNDDEWMVVYEPMYENPAAKLFTRPCKEWREVVEWQGQKVERFVKV